MDVHGGKEAAVLVPIFEQDGLHTKREAGG